MLSRGLGVVAELALIAMIRDGSLKVETLYQADWDRVDQLVRTYADLGLGVTDASLIAIAERHNVTRIATIDRRHFAVVRPARCDAFELVGFDSRPPPK